MEALNLSLSNIHNMLNSKIKLIIKCLGKNYHSSIQICDKHLKEFIKTNPDVSMSSQKTADILAEYAWSHIALRLQSNRAMNYFINDPELKTFLETTPITMSSSELLETLA